MLGQGGIAVSPSEAKVKVTVPASVTIVPHIVQAIEAVKLCEGPTEGVYPVRTPTVVRGASPVSALNTIKPHIIKAIAAVQLLEEVEGVESTLL